MKNKNLILVAVVCTAALGIWGCSDLKTDLPSPVAPGVQAHRAEWVDTSSAGFHGKVVDAAHGNVQECLKCHGLNYRGGSSGISCVACHQTKGASLHGRGWTDPSSPNFHGNTIRSAGWDMRSCQACHGALYDGGKVGVSCRDCHRGGAGPENCATCHGSANSPAPPRDLSKNTSRTAEGVGAHQIHLLGSSIANAMPCSDCHIVPGSVYVAGHVDSTARAEVLFNNPPARTVTNKPGTIDYDPVLPLLTPSPSYDRSALQCSNTYCHGYFKNGNLTFAPTWNDATTASGACGTCHGNVTTPLDSLGLRYVPRTTAQGGTHPDPTGILRKCDFCHGEVVDANFRIINPSKHVNGKLNIKNFVTLQNEERDY